MEIKTGLFIYEFITQIIFLREIDKENGRSLF